MQPSNKARFLLQSLSVLHVDHQMLHELPWTCPHTRFLFTAQNLNTRFLSDRGNEIGGHPYISSRVVGDEKHFVLTAAVQQSPEKRVCLHSAMERCVR